MVSKNDSKITVCIHQIEHIPHLSLFVKFAKADVIVLGDNFQFKKNYYENRNKIRTKEGWQWITIPVEKDNHKPIKDIKVIDGNRWKEKYLNAIKQNYSKSLNFDKYYPVIEKTINISLNYLIEYNMHFLFLLWYWFGIDRKFYLASELGLNPELKATDLLLEICKKLKADTYLSGPSGKDYLELEKFKEANIEVIFHEFEHPIYKQVYEPFIPGMSSIDYLFNKENQCK
jgi:hypothetical protein